MTTTGYL